MVRESLGTPGLKRCLLDFIFYARGQLPLQKDKVVSHYLSMMFNRHVIIQNFNFARNIKTLNERPGVHNLCTLSGRITFPYLNCGRQWLQDILFFCIGSVLLLHPEPGLQWDFLLAHFYTFLNDTLARGDVLRKTNEKSIISIHYQNILVCIMLISFVLKSKQIYGKKR